MHGPSRVFKEWACLIRDGLRLLQFPDNEVVEVPVRLVRPWKATEHIFANRIEANTLVAVAKRFSEYHILSYGIPLNRIISLKVNVRDFPHFAVGVR